MRTTSFLTRQAERLRWLPWGVRLILGALLVVLGVLVVLRPYNSLTLLIVLIAVALMVDGVARVIDAARPALQWIKLAAGVVEIVGAIMVVAWPLISVPVLALVVGVTFISSGASDLVGAFRRDHTNRAGDIMRGVALIIFGLLTVMWPDVSLIIIAVAFAARMIVFGVGVIVRAVRHRALRDRVNNVESGVHNTETTKHTPVFLRRLSLAGRALLLVLAVLVAAGSIYLHQGVAAPSAFYTVPKLYVSV